MIYTLYGHFTTDELIQLAGHPILWGDVQSSNITSDIHGPNFDNWNRIGVVRYPNRRAFFELMASEGYGETAAYKLMGFPVTMCFQIYVCRYQRGFLLPFFLLHGVAV
jgi:hypothetical protein